MNLLWNKIGVFFLLFPFVGLFLIPGRGGIVLYGLGSIILLGSPLIAAISGIISLFKVRNTTAIVIVFIAILEEVYLLNSILARAY